MTGLLRAFVLKPSTIVFLVLGSALLAAFIWQLSRDPGYILLVLGNYTVEMSAEEFLEQCENLEGTWH